MANLDFEDKEKRITESMQHLNCVKAERDFYTNLIELAKESLRVHPLQKLSKCRPCSFNGLTHVSFDFAQQVHVPNLPDQPGPIFFLTPYKLGLFGINNEAAQIQINYIIPECSQTGKGANTVISLLHHFLDNFTLGEDNLYLHADNCVGQNKNNCVMAYLCWRVIVGLNKTINISFLPVGHTKFSPDGGFGIIKSKFRRNEVCCAADMVECIENSTPITKMNRAQLVGNEAGEMFVNTYDWTKKFKEFKTIPSIKRYHHFSFSCEKEKFVQCKEYTTSDYVNFCLLNTKCNPSSEVLSLIEPEGLSTDRQWYLYETIRPLVPTRAQDIICPKPVSLRHTFAQTRSKNARESSKKKSDSVEDVEGVSTHKRKPQCCSYCHKTGHINRVINGVPACPDRRNQSATDDESDN